MTRRSLLAATLGLALLLPVPSQAGPLSWLTGSRVLNPRNWGGGYPRGARVVHRRPDGLDEQMLNSSYFFDAARNVHKRETLTVRLVGPGTKLTSGEIFGDETSVTGVYGQLHQFRQSLATVGESLQAYKVLEVRHTHPGAQEMHRKHFSRGDRDAARKLRTYLNETPGLQHMILRESVIYERGSGRQVTKVKTYELRPPRRLR